MKKNDSEKRKKQGVIKIVFYIFLIVTWIAVGLELQPNTTATSVSSTGWDMLYAILIALAIPTTFFVLIALFIGYNKLHKKNVIKKASETEGLKENADQNISNKWTFWRIFRWILFFGLIVSGYWVFQNYPNQVNQIQDLLTDKTDAPYADALADKAFPFCSQKWDASTGKGIGKVIHEGSGILQRMESNILRVVLVDKSKPYFKTTFDNRFENGVRTMTWSRFTVHPNSPQCTRGVWNWSDSANLSSEVVKNRKLDGVYSCTYADPVLKREGHLRHFWLNTEWRIGEKQCS